MDISTLFVYIVAVSAVMMVPGPSMLLALNNGASHGMRVAAFGMAGAALSDLILIAAVGCGLGALLQASEQLFSLVKWLGALYLLYLGSTVRPTGRAGRRRDHWPSLHQARAAALASAPARAPRPEGLLFFSAFLPQFIRPGEPVAQQYLVLALTSAVIDCMIMAIYAFGGRHAMRRFSARVMTWVNRSCSGMLAMLALGISLYRRSDLH